MVGAYLAVMGAVILERLVELWLSLRNARRSFAQGGREYGLGHWPAMVAIHALFLFAGPAEVILLHRTTTPERFWACLAGVIGTMALRYWAISTLGWRWNTRVIVVPGLDRVTGGPYRDRKSTRLNSSHRT